MSEHRRGALLGAASYLLWGLFPLYWPLLKPAGAIEILAHRIVWSVVVLAAILAASGRLAWVRNVERRKLALLGAAAAFISINWVTYIWAVNRGRVVEASLGYFINPLVTVALGVLVLGERLRRRQAIAIALASLAVLVLTLDYGRPPWIALALALSFGAYGLLKKQVGIGTVESLSFETALLAPPALVYLAMLEHGHTGAFGHGPLAVSVLLAMAGLVTTVPLLLFGAAANRIPLTTLGLLQYLSPMLQFTLGVVVFHEAMPLSRWAGFALVWAALAVFAFDAVRAGHRRALDARAA